MPSSVHDAASEIVRLVGPTEAMRLEKLVYYAQAWHLALTDEPLFVDELEAWRNGPVVRELWERHRGRRRVDAWPAGDPEKLKGESRQVISLVCQVYGRLSGDELSELTHSEAPWRQARGDLAAEERCTTVIPKQELKRFYRQRQLGNRTVADLAVGGLPGVVDDTLEPSERRERLRQIREGVSEHGEADEGVPAPIGAGASLTFDDAEAVTVRMIRERPQRVSRK